MAAAAAPGGLTTPMAKRSKPGEANFDARAAGASHVWQPSSVLLDTSSPVGLALPKSPMWVHAVQLRHSACGRASPIGFGTIG